jgi:hypothetical protein
MRVVGLGSAGCNIAKAFSKFPQYETYGIDTSKDADITIKERATHEEYDQKFPSLKRKLKFRDSEVLVITCGTGLISGGILRLLEQLKDNKVSILYVQPDLDLSSETQRMQERIVRNVLQEYARSGAVEMIYLADNLQVEKGIGEVPIMGYYDVLNQAIVNTFHMLNVFRNTEPVMGSFVNPSVLSRIATVGILEVDEGKEKWFYDLTEPSHVVYYYGINEEQLMEDGGLFGRITSYVKAQLEPPMDVSYGVFKTTYDQKYCYCIKYSSMVQSYKELLDDQDIG